MGEAIGAAAGRGAVGVGSGATFETLLGPAVGVGAGLAGWLITVGGGALVAIGAALGWRGCGVGADATGAAGIFFVGPAPGNGTRLGEGWARAVGGGAAGTVAGGANAILVPPGRGSVGTRTTVGAEPRYAGE